MCYRHATLTFDRPCPECGALQCNLSMYCEECGAELPYVAHPSQCEGAVMHDAGSQAAQPHDSASPQTELISGDVP